MGIFTNTNVRSYTSTDIYSPADQEINCEGYDPNFYEVSLMAVAESETVYNNAMKEIGIGELMYMEQYGTEMVYEAVDIKAIFGKIKMFFKKLLDKVKAIFHAFISKISSWVMSDKDFVKKYELEFSKKWNNVKEDFEFKGYKFTMSVDESVFDNINSETHDKDVTQDPTSVSMTVDEINKIVSDLKEHSEEIREELRAVLVIGFGGDKSLKSCDSKEFSEELFKAFRDGETSKVALEKKDLKVSEIIEDLKTASTVKKQAEKIIKLVTKSIDDDIREIEKFEKVLSKEKYTDDTDKDEKINARSATLAFCNESASILRSSKEYFVQGAGAYLEALKQKSRQNKAIMTKVIAGGKKMQRESYSYTNESTGSGSFLDSVVLK